MITNNDSRIAARKRSVNGELIKLDQFVERLQACKNALEKGWNKEAEGVPSFEKGNARVQALGKDGQKNNGSALDRDEPSFAAPQGSYFVITGFTYNEHADVGPLVTSVGKVVRIVR